MRVEMYDLIFKNLNSILLQTATHLHTAVPPVMIAQHRIDTERRVQVFQNRTKMLRLDPACDMDFIPKQPRAVDVEAALCNCLGFGSKNSALVLGRS